jgi:hypothetical protein
VAVTIIYNRWNILPLTELLAKTRGDGSNSIKAVMDDAAIRSLINLVGELCHLGVQDENGMIKYRGIALSSEVE